MTNPLNSNPLSAVASGPRQMPALKTTTRTVVIIPEGCHLMINAAEAGCLADARFVRIAEGGSIAPLAKSNIQTTTIPVADMVLEATDQAYFTKLQETANASS